jgi:drug/metabolite transporter (DMT)-like permease
MTDRPMTKRSWLGILLIAGGVALLIFAPQAQSCVTDYDLTMCGITSNPLYNVAGVVLIAIGGGLAVLGLAKRSS